MLLNFKNGHPPNTTGEHLCKIRNKKNKKEWYQVVYFDHKRKNWLNPINRRKKYKFEVLSWVRIREK